MTLNLLPVKVVVLINPLSFLVNTDGRTLPINRKQKVFQNGTLIIENVERQSDQATYTCVVQNEQGYVVKGNLEVQVMGKFKSSNMAPTLYPQALMNLNYHNIDFNTFKLTYIFSIYIL